MREYQKFSYWFYSTIIYGNIFLDLRNPSLILASASTCVRQSLCKRIVLHVPADSHKSTRRELRIIFQILPHIFLPVWISDSTTYITLPNQLSESFFFFVTLRQLVTVLNWKTQKYFYLKQLLLISLCSDCWTPEVCHCPHIFTSISTSKLFNGFTLFSLFVTHCEHNNLV